MNTSLEKLDLRGNRAATTAGLMALGESLKRNRGLKVLNLSCNNLSDSGVIHIAENLKHNRIGRPHISVHVSLHEGSSNSKHKQLFKKVGYFTMWYR